MMSSVKVAIVGSRGLTASAEEIRRALADAGWEPSEIISGGAVGVDTSAAQYARAYNIPLVEIRPDYAAFRGNERAAPLARNQTIVNRADVVLAFWDGKSRGTTYTTDYARSVGKPVKIVTR